MKKYSSKLTRLLGLLSLPLTFLVGGSLSAANIVQKVGANYIAWEAERDVTIVNGAGDTWVINSDSSASRLGALEAKGTTVTSDPPPSTAAWTLVFNNPGTYTLYCRYVCNSADGNGNSYKIPKVLGATTYWISDVNNDGTPNTYTVIKDTNTYTINPGDVGVPQLFQVGVREVGFTLDRLVLSQDTTLATGGGAGFNALDNTINDPRLLAVSVVSLTSLNLTFDQPLADSAVTPLSNFLINHGISVLSATLSVDQSHIALGISPLTSGTIYTITVSGVTNRSVNPDVITTTNMDFNTFLLVSADFLGRNGNGTPPPGVSMLPGDIAGVVPAPNWNNVDCGNTNNWSDTPPLTDNFGNPTPIILTYNADDNWNNDDGTAPASMTPNQKMMYGVIKNNSGNDGTARFYFSHVPQAHYDLYVYADVNGDNVQIDLSDGVTSYYTIEQHTFGGSFIQAKNTVSGGTRDSGNYVKFSNVYVSGAGQISLSAHYNGGGDGLGIAGFQLVQVFDTNNVNIVKAEGGLNTVTVAFNEAVSDSAGTPGNYTLSGGLTVSAATLDPSQRQVTLTTSTQTKGSVYTVTVNNNVTDREPGAHTVSPNSVNFTSAYPANIAVNFVGGNTATTPRPLLPTDVAGVVPTPNWNNSGGGTYQFKQPLIDVDGYPTPITITFRADEVWGSETGTSDANHKLMDGYLGVANDNNHGRDILLQHVPLSTYNLIVYTLRDNSGASESIAGLGDSTNGVYAVKSQGAGDFNGSPTFVRGITTDPNAPALCNYVQFDNIRPDASGQIRIPFFALPSGGGRAPTPGLQLIEVNTNALTFVTKPVDTTVKELQPFSFSASVLGALPHNAQWFTNGVLVAGLTGLQFTGAADKTLDGMQVYLIVDNGFSSITSSPNAVLHVLVDNTPPFLTDATADPIATHVRLVFSEPVSVATVDFQMSGGVTVTGTETLADGKTILLTTGSPLVPGQNYTLTMTNIHDLAGVPNLIVPNPTVTNFTGWTCTNGVLLRQIYTGESGPNNFTTTFADPNWPCNPAIVDYITTSVSPQSAPDRNNYSTRIRGYIIPTENANYTFQEQADDSARVMVSTDSSESNLVTLINLENACCPTVTQAGPPLPLKAGHAYFFQVFHQEGGGGDNVNVNWKNDASIAAFTPITAANLAYCVNPDALHVTIAGPNSATNFECTPVTFSVAASAACGAGAATYQWQTNGVDIPGANSPSYSIPYVHLSDNNTVFHVKVTLVGIDTFSQNAVLKVLQNTNPPTIVNVAGDATLQNVFVTFSEAVDPATATDAFSYSITDPGGNPLNITTTTGTLINDHTVQISTDPQAQGTKYTVAVNPGTLDLCLRTTIVNNVGYFTAWVYSTCFATWEVYNLGASGNGAIADLTSSAKYIAHAPDSVFFLSAVDSRLAYPDDSHDHYGSRFTNTFNAPANGTYVFYMQNDDAAQLFLDGTSVLNIGCCNGAFADGVASVTNTLTAGPHSMMVLQSEGGGGDYIRIAVRIPGDVTPAANLQPVRGALIQTWINPDLIVPTIVLPTNTMLALGTLTQRGFDGRIVKINDPITNSLAEYEALLAGTYADTNGGPFPNVALVPWFVETNIINYTIDTATYGHLTNETAFPGFPRVAVTTSNSEDFAMELLTYVELTAGAHTWGVNSDDGFRVSVATCLSDPNNTSHVLGFFDGGRGSSDTLFSFNVLTMGLYPMRLIYGQGNGGANLEWFEYDICSGVASAINGPGGPRAFRAPAPPVPTLTVTHSGGNILLCWPNCETGYCLQSSTNLGSTWSNVTQTIVIGPSTTCVTIPVGGAASFYRLIRQ